MKNKKRKFDDVVQGEREEDGYEDLKHKRFVIYAGTKPGHIVVVGGCVVRSSSQN